MIDETERKPLLPPPPEPLAEPIVIVPAPVEPTATDIVARGSEVAILPEPPPILAASPPEEPATPAVAEPATETATESEPIVLHEPVALVAAVTDLPGENKPLVPPPSKNDDSLSIPISHVETEAAPGHDDSIAEQRGVMPIRGAADASEADVDNVADVPANQSRRSRKLVVAAGIAGLGLFAIAFAMMWSRGSVAEAGAPAVPAAQAAVEQAAPIPQTQPVTQPSTQPQAELQTPLPAVQPVTCSVNVRASVASDAVVWVDGMRVGPAPAVVPAPCGATLSLEIRHPRYADFKQQVVVDSTVEVDAKLEREITMLTVWSEPSGAQVTYDGQIVGKTPLTFPARRYEQGHLYFQLAGYEADWRRINPKDAKKTVSARLKKLR